jgi:hypothetical protein
MKTIDFLPDIYRQREALRRARVWWAIVVVVFGGAIGASIGAQAWLRQNLANQLDELAPQYAAAQTQVRELSMLQSQIMRAGHEASLFTYLEHPWPRTQILAEIAAPAPAMIRLTQIHIGEEELARPTQQAGPRRRLSIEDESGPKLLPPEEDFARLQDEMDRRQTFVELVGFTTDVDRLHQYVADLSRSPLVATAQIKRLEVDDKQLGRTQFTLRLIIRPGYGQRGRDAAVAAAADPRPYLQTRATAPQAPAYAPIAGGGGG